MNNKRNTKTKRLATTLAVAATSVMAPALLFAGTTTAQADTCDAYDDGYQSCSPGGIGFAPGGCYVDPAQQAAYNSGCVDAVTGQEPDPPTWMPSTPISGPNLQSTMGPFTGAAPEPDTGSSLPGIVDDLARAGNCALATAAAVTTCGPIAENPALGLTPIGGACAASAVDAYGACESVASDIWDSLPDF